MTREVTRVITRVFVPTREPSPTVTRVPVLTCYLPPDDRLAAVDHAATQRLGQELTALARRPVEVRVPSTYAESVDALCRGEADLCWLATPAFLLAEETCVCEPVFQSVRQGSAYHQYQWIVLDAGERMTRGLAVMDTLGSLSGAPVAFSTDVSTTGYLFPKSELIERGIVPSEEMFVGGDRQAVLAVLRGEVDAAATYYAPPGRDGRIRDARARLLLSVPDIADQVRILALSELIPNDPLVVRSDLDASARQALLAAWVDVFDSPYGGELLQRRYGVSEVQSTSSEAYGVVRRMVSNLDLDPAGLLGARQP